MDISVDSSQLLDTPNSTQAPSGDDATPGEHLLGHKTYALDVEGLSLRGIVPHPQVPTTSTPRAPTTPARPTDGPPALSQQAAAFSAPPADTAASGYGFGRSSRTYTYARSGGYCASSWLYL